MLGFGGLLIVVCWARCGGWQAMLRLVVIVVFALFVVFGICRCVIVWFVF